MHKDIKEQLSHFFHIAQEAFCRRPPFRAVARLPLLFWNAVLHQKPRQTAAVAAHNKLCLNEKLVLGTACPQAARCSE
ncbi:hypothetical protein [Desulfatirhabdium butyrativorans]|uniref:hypothetical protein n=1 Tax=Desulfatirhabdium butyrativorans TaxID=340467 RepID=UPI0012EC029E|nr:hypothetical protein [Desulfatirhabdium butyrativorans]